jgi:hypothetical protein
MSAAAKAIADAAAKAAAKGAAEAAQISATAAARASADSIAATTARVAADAAKASADEAAAAAKAAATSGEAGNVVASLAARADSLANAAKSAAKSADEAAILAAKSADDAAGAAKSAAKTADDAVGAAGKSGKGMSKTTAAAALASGAALAGGILYIDKELRDANEKIKDCMKVCLPENWDDYVYGENIEESELKYKEIDEDMGEQPLCNEKIKDCADFCENKCTELHEADLPGGGIADQFVKGAEDIFKLMNPFKGIGNIASMAVGGVLLFLIIGGGAFILIKILTSRRSRESATN